MSRRGSAAFSMLSCEYKQFSILLSVVSGHMWVICWLLWAHRGAECSSLFMCPCQFFRFFLTFQRVEVTRLYATIKKTLRNAAASSAASPVCIPGKLLLSPPSCFLSCRLSGDSFYTLCFYPLTRCLKIKRLEIIAQCFIYDVSNKQQQNSIQEKGFQEPE